MDVQREGEDEFALWAMIIQSRDIIFHARDKELSQYGITAVEARALYILNRVGDRATPAMISREMVRGHNTVTALFSRMENKGLIEKERDPYKKNSWLISLTKKGKKAYANSLKREMIKDVFSVIPNADLIKMTAYLEEVMERASKYLSENGTHVPKIFP